MNSQTTQLKWESMELAGKNKCHYQICFSIRVNSHREVKKETLKFSSISDKSTLIKFMQTSQNNNTNMM